MSNIIEVQHLKKKYRSSETLAVDDVSFSVKSGEFFTLLGPNGAGKTTTISILSTTLTKTSGTVNIAGYDIDKQPSQVRQHIGIIFQNPSLDRNLTAEENIRFHASLYGLFPFRPSYSLMDTAYKKKVHDLSTVLGLQDQMFQPVKTYSGGMKRKLEILRSIMHNPKVLFLDEPTSGLDPESRKNLWEYLLGIRKKEKMTIFLTTHYLAEAEDADTICIINHGKIVTMGTPRLIKSSLVDEYLVLDSANRKALTDELTKKKLSWETHEHIHVSLNGVSAQSVITSLSTKLSVLDIHTPTLEEAYLDVVSSNTQNGGSHA